VRRILSTNDRTTILLYESEHIVLRYLVIFLEACGFIIQSEVSRLDDLKEEVSKTRPDVIIISQFEQALALRAINDIMGITEAPIVLCTSLCTSEDPRDRLPAQAMGVSAVVSRTPEWVGCLVAAIRRCQPRRGSFTN
jgi:chemotaxis response regulator CheB